MKSLFLFILFHFQLTAQTSIENLLNFQPSQTEIGCMRHFKIRPDSNNLFNHYVLSKLSENMYPERLDYNLRFLKNGRKPLDSIPSTKWLKDNQILTERDFEDAFRKRYEHMFSATDSVTFKYLFAMSYSTTAVNRPKKYGFDPEVIVISTTKYVILVFRGTDLMDDNRRGEWIGTDFNGLKSGQLEYFENGRLHRGFGKAAALIFPLVEYYLVQNNLKSKPIWLTGHSLGGAMAILVGTKLSEVGFDISQIPVFAAPNTLGNKKAFSEISQEVLDKIERYEYNLDPFSAVRPLGYYAVGKRNYITLNSRILVDIPHRSLRINSYTLSKDESMDAELATQIFMRNIFKIKREFFHHNPQWYSKSIRCHLINSELENCPDLDDSFPYLYYGWQRSI